MLKLISGSLVGGVKYSDLYIDSDKNEYTTSTSSSVNESDKDHGKKKMKRNIPTLPQIARKVARLEKTQLDEKQYIAYEMIACTFLLGLLNDGSDKNTKLGGYLQQTMEIATTADANDVIKKIKSKRWTRPTPDVSDGASWFGKNHCNENCTAILLRVLYSSGYNVE
jgi:hypothetical protein